MPMINMSKMNVHKATALTNQENIFCMEKRSCGLGNLVLKFNPISSPSCAINRTLILSETMPFPEATSKQKGGLT